MASGRTKIIRLRPTNSKTEGGTDLKLIVSCRRLIAKCGKWTTINFAKSFIVRRF